MVNKHTTCSVTGPDASYSVAEAYSVSSTAPRLALRREVCGIEDL